MATIKRCDICKKLFESSDGVRRIELPHTDRHEQAFTDETDGYTQEACIGCVRKIKAVIAAINREAVAEERRAGG